MDKEIIEQNERMVHKIVNQYYPPKYLEREDLVQVGMMALWKAHEKFNVNKGVKFSTFAYTFIRNELKKFIRDRAKFEDYGYLDGREYRIPLDEIPIETQLERRELLERLKEEENQLIHYLYLGYSQQEIAEKLGVSQPNVCRRIRQLRIKFKKDVEG